MRRMYSKNEILEIVNGGSHKLYRHNFSIRDSRIGLAYQAVTFSIWHSSNEPLGVTQLTALLLSENVCRTFTNGITASGVMDFSQDIRHANVISVQGVKNEPEKLSLSCVYLASGIQVVGTFEISLAQSDLFLDDKVTTF